LTNALTKLTYLNKTHETNLVRQQLLQTLAIAAGLCHQAITITNLATNSYCAAVSLTNPMKAFQVKAFDHINEMIRELSITSNINTKHHAHTIANTVIDMLEGLPNEGNQSKIEAADRLVKACRKPIATRPSSPENIEMEPIPIPTPKPTQSGWQTVINELQPLLNGANKENIPPTNTTTALDHQITNWNKPSLMQEVNHLRHYITGIPPPTFPTIFKLTNNYLFLNHQEDKTSHTSYWNLILSKFFHEGIKTDQYKGKPFRYAKARRDNAKLFIGIDNETNQWYFTKNKHSLFNVIEGGIF
jgi:hypothetical protein